MEPFGFTHFIAGMFLQISCNTAGALFTSSSSMKVHTFSMPCHAISPLFLLITLAVRLGSLSCWRTKLLPIRARPMGTAWWMISAYIWVLYDAPLHCMKQSLKLVDIPPPCFTVMAKHGLPWASLFFVYCLKLFPNSSNFFSSMNIAFFPLPRCPCFVSSGSYECFLLVTFPQHRFSYSYITSTTCTILEDTFLQVSSLHNAW